MSSSSSGATTWNGHQLPQLNCETDAPLALGVDCEVSLLFGSSPSECLRLPPLDRRPILEVADDLRFGGSAVVCICVRAPFGEVSKQFAASRDRETEGRGGFAIDKGGGEPDKCARGGVRIGGGTTEGEGDDVEEEGEEEGEVEGEVEGGILAGLSRRRIRASLINVVRAEEKVGTTDRKERSISQNAK